MNLPPDWRVATCMPPWADGKTRLGVWPVPGPYGPQALALAIEPVTRDIEGKIDGQTVLYCQMPRTQPVTTSVAWPVCGHEVVVYAETLGPGRPVRCDVFVDGWSLTTGEPLAVAVSKRAKGLARKSPLTTASNLIWIIPGISLVSLLRLPSYGTSGVAPVAIVGGAAIAFGVAVFLVEFCPTVLRRPIGVAIERGHTAPYGTGSQGHQQPGPLSNRPQHFGVALGEYGAFHQGHVQRAAGIVSRRTHQEIPDVDKSDQIQKLIFAIEDGELIPRAPGKAEDSNRRFAHPLRSFQIISGRLMASQ